MAVAVVLAVAVVVAVAVAVALVRPTAVERLSAQCNAPEVINRESQNINIRLALSSGFRSYSWPALVDFVQTAAVSPPPASTTPPETAQPPRPLKPVSDLGPRQFARRQKVIKEQLAEQGLTIEDVAAVAQGASKKRPAPSVNCVTCYSKRCIV